MKESLDIIFKVVGILTFVIIDIYLIQKIRFPPTTTTMKIFKTRLFWEITIFLIVSIFIFFTPWIFIHDSFRKTFNFSETGAIGDTINGIAGPFIAFFAAILVYLTLRAQIKANLLLKEQNDFKFLLDNITSLEQRQNVHQIFTDAITDFNQNEYDSQNIKVAVLLQSEFKNTLDLISQIITNRKFLESKIKLAWTASYRNDIELLNRAIVNRGVIAGIAFVIGTPLSFSQDFNYIERRINEME